MRPVPKVWVGSLETYGTWWMKLIQIVGISEVWEGFAERGDIWAELGMWWEGAQCSLKCQEDYHMNWLCLPSKIYKNMFHFYQLKCYWFCPLPFLWSLIKQWNLIYSQFCYKMTYRFINPSCCTENCSLWGNGVRGKHKNFIRGTQNF